MSPEILNKEHYKSASDIYSFSITMYEVMIWGEAYPKSEFKFEWNIASFVKEGNRLSLNCISNSTIKEIISHSWKQEPKERYTIDEIELKLKECLEE